MMKVIEILFLFITLINCGALVFLYKDNVKKVYMLENQLNMLKIKSNGFEMIASQRLELLKSAINRMTPSFVKKISVDNWEKGNG